MTIKKLAPFFFLLVLIHVNSSCSVYQNDGRKNFESDILTSEKISAHNLQLRFCEKKNNSNDILRNIEEESLDHSQTLDSIDASIAEFNSIQSQFIVTKEDSILHVLSLNTTRSCSYEMTQNFTQQDCADILRGLYNANH